MAAANYNVIANKSETSECAPPKTGFIISEMREYDLRTVAEAMDYVAELAWYDGGETMPEHDGKGLAALLRTFAKSVRGSDDQSFLVTTDFVPARH